MTERAYDPDLLEMIPLLPTVTDFDGVEGIQQMRGGGGVLFVSTDPHPDALRLTA